MADHISEKFQNVWCPNCETIRPLRTDEMAGGKLNDHDALDLLCGDCDFVIATLHASKAEG